ncbi:MAG: M48 family metalloprotease [Phycisphaerales bacterium]
MRTPLGLVRTVLLSIPLALGSLAQVGCTTNPATGARSFTLLSWDEERQIGAEAAPGMTDQFGGEVNDATTEAYMDEVGHKLVAQIEEGVPQLEWEFTLLDSDVINAFALPGGKVFMSRGLAEVLTSEAEMAGVLGHEIGHVTARHGNQRISAQMGMNIALAAGAVAVGAADEDSTLRKYGQVGVPALAIGGNLLLLKYGRKEELQADALGVRYMTRAMYDPKGQEMVMEALQAASGGSSPPEWLSTHPATETRIQKIQQMLAGDYAYTQGNPEYKMYEERYRQRMLSPLSDLPPAKHTARALDAEDGSASVLANSWLWCAHCRAEHLAALGASRTSN